METTYDNLRKEQERLQEDLERKRISSSQASKDLVVYVEKIPEPLFPKSDIPNPFRAKVGGCWLL